MSTHSIAAAGERASIFEVVKLVDTELHDLLARREELTSRIQSLHQVMHGLRESVRPPRIVNPSGVAGESTQERERTGSAGRGRPSEKRYGWGHNQLRLARACRIALMESEEAVSLEEIYSRISRRDSFSFMSFELAAPVLVRALSDMAGSGEVRCINHSSHQRWERIGRVVESEVAPSTL